MGLIKGNHHLEIVTFQFDGAGEVEGVTVTVNYAVLDDVSGAEETRVRKSSDIWDQLTTGKKTQAKQLGKRLAEIAKTL